MHPPHPGTLARRAWKSSAQAWQKTAIPGDRGPEALCLAEGWGLGSEAAGPPSPCPWLLSTSRTESAPSVCLAFPHALLSIFPSLARCIQGLFLYPLSAHRVPGRQGLQQERCRSLPEQLFSQETKARGPSVTGHWSRDQQ